MKKRTKWTVAGAIGLAIVIIGVTSAMKGRNKATEVRMEKIQRRDLVASVTASGQVQPHTKADISADISGRIVRLAVQDGQVVTRGQFLLEIDPASYKAAVERATAAVESARSQAAQAKPALLQAQRNFDRLMALKKANPTLVSDEQIEELRTQVEVNQATMEAANHAVDQATASFRDSQVLLSKTTIVAPMSGRVTRLIVHEGETAIPGTFNKDAATMLTISDMSVLETKVKVDETDVSRIKIGDSTVVQLDAFPDTTFIGRVSEISNSSVKGASTGGTGGSTDQAIDYEVTIQLLNTPHDTRSDMSSTAKIITSTRNNVLSIPIIALTVREDSVKPDTSLTLARKAPSKEVGKRDVEGVFVVGANNKVTFRPVKVGIAGEKYFEVLSGLKEGENIVGGTYQAIRELKDGATVRALKDQPKKAGEPAKS
jgi:HlyD family secretion protein